MNNELLKNGITPAFMASSIREFRRERTMLSALTAEYNGSDSFVYINMEKCEHVYDNMVLGGKQGEYDNIILSSMVFILLAGKYLGKYTIGEIDIAIKNNVRIFVIKKSDGLADKYDFDPADPNNSGCRLTDEVIAERIMDIPSSAVTEYSCDEELKAAFTQITNAIEKEELYKKAKLTFVPYRIGISAQNSLSYDFACTLADSINKENDSRADDAVREQEPKLLMSVKIIDSVDNTNIGSEFIEFDAVFFIITEADDRSVQTLSVLWKEHQEFIENKYISSYVYNALDDNNEEFDAVFKIMDSISHYPSYFGSEAELLNWINGTNKLLDDVNGVFPDYMKGMEEYNSGSSMDSIKHLEKAAKHFSHAAYLLGIIRRSQCMNGDALKLLKQAALRGHSLAQLESGKLLFSMNNTQSERFYRMSAQSGNPEAMFRLSVLYKDDGKEEEALKLCMDAADGGYFEAMHNAYVQLRERGDMRAAHYLSLYTENAAAEPTQDNMPFLEENQFKGDHYIIPGRSAKIDGNNYTIHEAKDKNSPDKRYRIKQFTNVSEKIIESEIEIYKKICEKLNGHSSCIPMMIESDPGQGFIVTEYFGGKNILKWWETRTRPYTIAKKEYLNSIGSDMSNELKSVLKNNYLTAAAAHKKHISELTLLFRPLLNDIALMHNVGFMHCDIRCENIMYSEENGEGRLHLINFGMARTLPQENGEDLLDRAEGYFPQNPFAEGAKNIGGEYDIYSICTVLFRLVTGRFPDECATRAEQDRLLKKEGAGHSFREAVLKGISRGKKRFAAVGYYDRNRNKTQENSLVYYLYHRSSAQLIFARAAKGLFVTAAITFFIALIFLFFYYADDNREVIADVSYLSEENILRSDYEWKDKALFNAFAIYEWQNRYTEELTAGNCESIKTLVINNGKITLISTKETFTGGFSQNELYNSAEFKYEKAPHTNDISSLEDITEFFPNLTTLAIYNCPLADKDTDGREYSALADLKELKYLKLNNCGYTNLSVFEGAEQSKLKWIAVRDNGRLEDLSPLCSLPELLEIDAEYNEYVNISGLENAKALIDLKLIESKYDAEKLAGLTNIKYLSVSSFSAEDIEYIGSMSWLELLYLHNTDFTGCTEKLGELIKALPKLSKLSIAACVFDSFDMLTEQLEKSDSLDTLYISGIKFEDESEIDVTKLFFLNNVEHAPEYEWQDSNMSQLYKLTEGTDKIGFNKRKTLMQDTVSVVIEPSGLKCFNSNIKKNDELILSEYLITLEHQNAEKTVSLEDIPKLCPNAKILVIRDVTVENEDISVVKDMPFLEEIVLENCSIKSASFFGELKDTKIHTVKLGDMGEITDLDALKALPELKYLTVVQSEFDPSELTELSQLEWLEVCDSSDERLLHMLEDMKSLKFLALNMVSVNEEELVDALLKCPTLQTIELRSGTVTSAKALERLSGMPALVKLDLKGSDIPSEELEKLTFCEVIT